MLLHPLPVGGYRRWQGREDPLFADLLGEAEGRANSSAPRIETSAASE
jgi:hypothetical protein